MVFFLPYFTFITQDFSKIFTLFFTAAILKPIANFKGFKCPAPKSKQPAL